MRKPLTIMEYKVYDILKQTNNPLANLNPIWKDLKYMIYSAHDTQVDNMEYWLNPSDYEMDYILFASNIFFELKYSQ